MPHTIRPANINKDTEKIKTRLDNMNIWIGVRNSHPGNINLIKSELKRMRSIRINLLRLHSEVECFRNIMRYINKYGLILEGESRERKLFNKYLKGLYPRIFKYVKNDNFNAVDESMEGKFAFSAMRREYPGEFSGLLDILHNLEVMPQVFKANSHSFYVIANRNMGNLREEINLLIELMEKEARKPVHHDQLFLINQARIAIESENHAEAMMNLKKLN